MEVAFGIMNREWFDPRRFDFKLLKELLAIAIPLLPNFLIYWVFNSCDKVMITNMIGIGAAGIYSVGSKLGYLRPIRQSFKRRSSLSGMPLPLLVRKQSRMKIFKTSCRMNTTFSSKPNVGVIAICRRNGTSSYRSVLWEKAAKENVWKDSLFRTPRRICGTRKNPY